MLCTYQWLEAPWSGISETLELDLTIRYRPYNLATVNEKPENLDLNLKLDYNLQLQR